MSVVDEDTPRAPDHVFDGGFRFWVSVMASRPCAQLGGKVEAGNSREFGRAEVDVLAQSPV